MRQTWFVLACATTLAGCATSAAQRAFDSGDDVGAAKLADDAVEANPRDGAAIALRRRARDHAARRELGETAALRASGHAEAALASLDRLLTQLSDWGGPEVLAPDARAALDTEVAVANTFVATIGARETDAGHPLAAEGELARMRPLLAHAELASGATAAEDRVRAAGASACTRLQTSVGPETTHWSLAVSRYCDHFGVAYTGVPLVGDVAKLEVGGDVSGMTPAQKSALESRVAAWVKRSLWYAPTGQATAHASLRGKIESSFQHQTITLHAPYQDVVATGTDTVQVKSSPFSSAPLGTPGSFAPNVGTHTESTTHYEKVDREYAYDTEESRGHYGLSVRVTLDVGASSPLAFTLQRVDNLKAYDHDAMFEKANVAPVHDAVPSTDEWLVAQLDRMETRVILYLNRKFVALNCEANLDSIDVAARCAAVGQTPRAAIATLTRALGEDAQRALPLFRPAPPRPTTNKSPALPAQNAAHARAAAEDDDPVID